MDPETHGTTDRTTHGATRIDFLDGIRALAAGYVVLHHVWLTSYPGYHEDPGPWGLRWLAFGYVAVAVFIVVSGFSLALSPARHGWRLTHGAGSFFRRRAWRILPAYYGALLLSCVVFGLVTPEQTGGQITVRSVLVHALLVQDVVDSPDPNATFWSIAVECQIYLLFPLFLLLARRVGLGWLVVAVTAVVVALKVLAGTVGPAAALLNLTPEFAALFVMGLAAGRAVTHAASPRAAGWLLAAASLLGGTFAILCLVLSIPEVERGYFWVSFLVGGAAACLIASLVLGGAGGLRRLLASRPLSGVGLFSYSVYLIHLPVLWLLWHFVVAPATDTPLLRFAVLGGLCVPAVLLASYAFFRCFERPFLTARTRPSRPEERPDVRSDARPADLAT